MQTYCDKFKYWLYHPEDTGLLCKNRAFKLRLPQCINCLGLEIPEQEPATDTLTIDNPEPEPIPGPSSDFELLEWIKANGMAQIGRMIGNEGVDRRAVQKWVKKGKIPNKYRDLLFEMKMSPSLANGFSSHRAKKATNDLVFMRSSGQENGSLKPLS